MVLNLDCWVRWYRALALASIEEEEEEEEAHKTLGDPPLRKHASFFGECISAFWGRLLN